MNTVKLNNAPLTPLRKDALAIIQSGYKALDIPSLIKKKMRLRANTLTITDGNKKKVLNLSQFERVVVIGFGKGSFLSVSTIADILGKKMERAIALDVKNSCKPKKPNKKVDAYFGTHPTPSPANVRTTKKIIKLAQGLKEKDLVLYFVGGGGSSLLCGSPEELRCATGIFNTLTKKGADIKELNTVRKHTSVVKGGWLAKYTHPATSISLIVSDVCGNDLSTIASGPTVFDKSTLVQTKAILKKYKINSNRLSLMETPKEKKWFKNASSILLACNHDAAMAMLEKARQRGYHARIASLMLEKEAREALISFVQKVPKNHALILGGEHTVTIKGTGKGGRNQEACLGVMAKAIDAELNLSNVLAASISSDGFDNTPVAGVLVDASLLAETLKKEIDPKKYLKNNDSFHFFKKVGGHIVTPPNSFNVSDLMLVIRRQ